MTQRRLSGGGADRNPPREGPGSPTSAAGAQPATRDPGLRPRRKGARCWRAVAARSGMLTLAPEVSGAPAHCSRNLARENVLASLGHSRAGTGRNRAGDRARRAPRHPSLQRDGLRSTTASPGWRARRSSTSVSPADLICDGVPRAPLGGARGGPRARRAPGADHGPDRSQSPANAPDSIRLGGVSARRRGSRCGSRMAASPAAASRSIWRCATHSASRGSRLLEAVAACTLRPALRLGIERERGTLRPGARADFAVLGADGSLHSTWIGGEPVF